MTVNILGTKYKLSIGSNDSELKLHCADGVCKIYSKEICARKKADMLVRENSSDEEKERRYKEVLRHEILHAYFHESGMDNIDQDEEEQLIYWMARMFPSMLKTFKELDCVGDE